MQAKKKNEKAKINNKGKITAVKSKSVAKKYNSRSIYKNILSAFFVGIVTWVVLSPSLKNSFTNWDDPAYVYESEDIKSLSNENIKHIINFAYNLK